MKVADATNLITTNAVNSMNLFSYPKRKIQVVTAKIAPNPQYTLFFLPILGWSMIMEDRQNAATSTMEMTTMKRYLKFWLLCVREKTRWRILGRRIMTPQQMKQTVNHEDRRRMVDCLYLLLNIQEMGMLQATFPPPIFPSSSRISAIISSLGTQGTPFSRHINPTVQQTYSSLLCTHRYLKLSLPCILCSYIAYSPGRQMMNNRVRQLLSCSKAQPKKEVVRQPPDQYTLDFDRRVALTEAGEISVIYDAESGKQMPIPTPQKNLAIRKELKFQQMQEKSPKADCMPASHVMKAYRPQRSLQTCRQDPMATPKQTTVISNDCQNFPNCHSSVSMGRSSPRTMVSQPQLKRRRQRDRLSFSWAWPQPILVARR